MKKYFITYLIVLLTCNWRSLSAQEKLFETVGGEWELSPHQCLHESDYQRIYSMLTHRMEYLKSIGKIPEVESGRNIVQFGFPLKKSNGLDWNNFYGISGFVDQDSGSGVQDFNCSTRTYDGHNGIDYFTWPFPWHLMENNLVEVVAVADGIIIAKDDGNSSYSCSWDGNQNWNAVYVRHSDGSIAWYGHLKQSSLTTKPPGSTVKKGEFLGIVGSSGRSTGPHLHLEVYKSGPPFNRANLVEPHSGPCNALNPGPWWDIQEPYSKPTINTILTHSGPILLGCPTPNENFQYQKNFSSLDVIFFSRFFKDQKKNTTSIQRIYTPNNNLWHQWQFSYVNDFNASWWYDAFQLPSQVQTGVWRYEVEYEGQKAIHHFNVNSVSSANEYITSAVRFYPNPVTDILTVNIAEENSSNGTLSVYDLNGVLLINKEIEKHFTEIDLTTLMAGIYQLKFIRGADVISKKLVKIN